MTSERIKEIQETTAYPESTSVKQALLQVWHECEMEAKQSSITAVVQAKPEVCPCCYGTGTVEGTYVGEIESCLTCGGSGKLSGETRRCGKE